MTPLNVIMNPKLEVIMVTINEDTIDELRELMEDDFIELIQSFIDDIQVKIQQIQNAIEHCDCDSLRQKSHSLKGSARNIGAEEMSDLCYHLEKAGKEKNLEDVQEIYQKLEKEVNNVKEILIKMVS